MKPEHAAQRVTIYVGETDHHDGHALYEAIVTMLRANGVAGAMVTRGMLGYGASGRTHSAHLLDLAEDLPVAIVFVDSAEKVQSVMPELDRMLETGLVTIEDVRAVTYGLG